ETVGLVMAALLLLGRYTGYRLTELYRFRDFVRDPLPEPARVVAGRFEEETGPRISRISRI
uniref:7TM domain-containing protein n=1 Tax=Salmonella sp. SAL4436 TaxID=3159891 RepID=UPI00397ADEAF